MTNKLIEAQELLTKAANSLVKDSQYYDTHIQVRMIPHANAAMQLIAAANNADSQLVAMCVDFGVFLTLRYQDTLKLKEIYGDTK